MNLFRVRSEAKKPFMAVCLSHMLVEVFLLMPSALLPVFISEFKLSIFQAGLLITIPNLCRRVIVIPTGIFVDKFGSRPVIILSILIAGISALLISQCNNALFLLVLLCTMKISETLYHPAGMSIISKLFLEQSERSTNVGFHGATGCLGQSIGTVSLGLMLSGFGWRLPYLIFSLPLIAWMIIFYRLQIPQLTRYHKLAASLNKVKNEKERLRSFIFKFSFIMLLISMGLYTLSSVGVNAFTTTFLISIKGLSVESASIVFGAGPLTGIIGSLVAGYVASKVGDKNTLTLLYAGQVIFLLGLIAIPVIQFATMSFLMYQLLMLAIWTPSTSLVANMIGKNGGGTAYSLFYFAGDMLAVISPLIAAILIETFGIFSLFIFAIVLFASSGLIVQLIKVD